MNNRDQSQYDIMFYESLKRGHTGCAKLIYPNVTNLTIIKLQIIIRDFYGIIDDYDNNDANCNDNPDLEIMDSLLQRYHDVFEFLVDINFVYDPSSDHPESFFSIAYDTYKMLKKHPIYYKITELIFRIMKFDKTKIISDAIRYGTISGLYLLSDINVLESADLEFANIGFNVSPVDKYVKLLMKYNNLTNNNLQKIINVNFGDVVGSFWADERKIFTNLINFVQKNGFHFVITNEMLKNNFSLDTYQKILNSGIKWEINEPIGTTYSDVYELLQENDINVVMFVNENEEEEEDCDEKKYHY